VRRQRDDRGSLAVELVIAAPLLLGMLSLVYGYGRVSQVNGTLEAGTRDAARVATQERTLGDAQDAAERAVETSVPPGPCRDTVDVVLSGDFLPGETLTVQARCTYPLDDVLPGLPGDVTARSEFSSPLDPNRGAG
jgi:hypothetical protein